MEANRFFSVSYDIRHHPKVRMLEHRQNEHGGVPDMATLGRYIVLLSLLYDAGGTIAASDDTASLMMQEMDIDRDYLGHFLDDCAAVGLIDAAAWESLGDVTSRSVVEQIEYRRSRKEAAKYAGKKSGEARRERAKKKANEHSNGEAND